MEEIIFLGTSSGVPTRERNVSSVALSVYKQREIWLFDCGEGTQHQLLRAKLNFNRISRIFITHMHGDHIFGLMGLLTSMSMSSRKAPLFLYGPAELTDYLNTCQRLSDAHLQFPLHIHPVASGRIFEDAYYQVDAALLLHRIPAHGYRITQKSQMGHFNAAAAQALGVKPGQAYALLKQGKCITLETGQIIDGSTLCGTPSTAKTVAYCTDTTYTEATIELAYQADVLIHEATYADEHERLAQRALHSTASMAARVAQLARVKQLVLTHFSPRYTAHSKLPLDTLFGQAQQIFPQVELAHDLKRYSI